MHEVILEIRCNLKLEIYDLSVTLASHLKLNTETVVADIHWATFVHHYSPDECLESVLKVPRGCQDVTSNKFMFGGVLTQEIFHT